MICLRKALLVMVFAAVLCSSLTAQLPDPKDVTLLDIATRPQTFDGELVRVRGLMLFGWDGDAFLVRNPKVPEKLSGLFEPHLWFHSDLPNVFTAAYTAFKDSNGFASATFTGWFHFVPDLQGRANSMYDPGPFQMDVLNVSEIRIEDASLSREQIYHDTPELLVQFGVNAEFNLTQVGAFETQLMRDLPGVATFEGHFFHSGKFTIFFATPDPVSVFPTVRRIAQNRHLAENLRAAYRMPSADPASFAILWPTTLKEFTVR